MKDKQIQNQYKLFQIIKEDEVVNKTTLKSKDPMNQPQPDAKHEQQSSDTDKFPQQRDASHLQDLSLMDCDQAANDWLYEQNKTLFDLFSLYGSRWTKIAHQMKGRYSKFYFRSQNCVKNRFYGSLRKALRKMNRAVKNLPKKVKKEIKYESITRIIDASEGLFRFSSPLKQESENLSRKILSLAQSTEVQMSSSEAKQLILQINKFNMATRSYKSKRKIKNQRVCHKKNCSTCLKKTKTLYSSLQRINQDKYGTLDNLGCPTQSTEPKKLYFSQELCEKTKMEAQMVECCDDNLKWYDDAFILDVESIVSMGIVNELFTQVHSPLECELWI